MPSKGMDMSSRGRRLTRASKSGGELPYEGDGDARRKVRIKPLKEPNLGMAQALSDRKRRPC